MRLAIGSCIRCSECGKTNPGFDSAMWAVEYDHVVCRQCLLLVMKQIDIYESSRKHLKLHNELRGRRGE